MPRASPEGGRVYSCLPYDSKGFRVGKKNKGRQNKFSDACMHALECEDFLEITLARPELTIQNILLKVFNKDTLRPQDVLCTSKL